MSAIDDAAEAVAKKQRDCFEVFLTPAEIAAEIKRELEKAVPAMEGKLNGGDGYHAFIDGHNECRKQMGLERC